MNLRHACKSGKTAVTSLKVNGVSIINPTDLSNEFNNHFATVGSELSRNVLILQMEMFIAEVHHQRRPMFSAPSDQC